MAIPSPNQERSDIVHNEDPQFFQIKLKFKSPTSEAEHFDLNESINDINEAVKYYNSKNRQTRIIVLLGAGIGTLEILLGMSDKALAKLKTENITARQIRVFTAYLYNEKKWSIYSREENKLFIGNGQILRIEDTKAREVLKKVVGNPVYANIDFSRWIPLKPIIEMPARYNINALRDEDIVKVLDYLISMKDVGNEQICAQKRATIEEIKILLLPWM